MTGTKAALEGIRRLLRAPGLILLFWSANLLIAAPLAVYLSESIHAFTARSEYAGALRDGFDTGWYAEYSTSGGELAKTFTPAHVGVGAWLANLDRWWDGRVFLEQPAVLATGLIYALVGVLLLGGVLEGLREGSPRPRLATVLADGSTFFPRLLRVVALTAIGYYGVFRLARWVFPQIHQLTADSTSEREVLAWNLAAAVLVALLLVLLRLSSDFAKIWLVLERRKSATMGLLNGIRFVAAHPVRIGAIAGVYGALLAVLYLAYSFMAPGAGESSQWGILSALVVGQIFLMTKFALRLAFQASELAFYEVPE